VQGVGVRRDAVARTKYVVKAEKLALRRDELFNVRHSH
jgi:hypothetical protein